MIIYTLGGIVKIIPSVTNSKKMKIHAQPSKVSTSPEPSNSSTPSELQKGPKQQKQSLWTVQPQQKRSLASRSSIMDLNDVFRVKQPTNPNTHNIMYVNKDV